MFEILYLTAVAVAAWNLSSLILYCPFDTGGVI